MIFPLKNNGNIKSTVLSFISSRRIPHAILIEGDNPEEQSLLADFIAEAAVCGEQDSPCGNCLNCKQAESHNHPDINYITVAEGKKNLSVNQVRDVRNEAFVKPHIANKRVFIIKDACRMNEQGQNALLKVLEEPPQSVIFILTVPSKTLLLDTIISRCVVLSLYSQETQKGDYGDMAEKFLDLLISGSEYDMLKLLTPLEKNRNSAEDFFQALAIECSKRLKKRDLHARVYDRLFDDTKYYIDLLKTNINMTLLISTADSNSKGLLDMSR